MACLEYLPNEIIETIVSLLELTDIRNLRLTSRGLALRSSGHHFKSHFRRKHVDITESTLRDFVQATKPGRLGRLVQYLVLVGSHLPTEKQGLEAEDEAKTRQDLEVLAQRRTDYRVMRSSGTDVRLLSEAFGNLMAQDGGNNTAGGPRLRTLSLKVVVYHTDAEQRLPPKTGGWVPIWQVATETFHTALRALAISAMPVAKLDIYTQQSRSSLACSELSAVDHESSGLVASLASVKSLSVSFSDRIINGRRENLGITGGSADEVDRDAPVIDDFRDNEDVEAEACDESTFIGLVRLVQLCSGLKELELHHYKLGNHTVFVDLHREQFLQRIVAMTTLTTLKRCALRGLTVREVDLLAFIKETAPAIVELTLQNVSLVSGTFRAIFDHCTSEASCLTRLFFDDLFEQKLLYFVGEPGQSKLRSFNYQCSETLDRTGPEVRRPISYFIPLGRPKGSPALWQWRMRRRREFGPP
ncbi:predicted protein [Aspergillus nidulans FGSC A4]|uniref:F-box domain protein (AFU_orthologue AFUA_3G01810) n=1 Tax=Emericella nidulans (strain FGSC A4 / ATCC 38163 / CBS 112.46 / NRRL 194 / M139) TaxID=227321 RepID=Q5AX94_EMENI|nr:hypothetical protein [Aspergillus nidulans FGSC A4]EAA61215.1 predicted protein [Aspergillus nidulans FGSC A4]CBF79112.1 TPA: F-box domain protein (AFU_orthologue; AFUA_3G01810) [Aspergillus nidulans FGSC A4]|eukprot:XP_664690.1 predicted protein [Aspergillus nidulans FGSC A4]